MPISIENILDIALWLSGIGHFCLLGASFQVPTRLKWQEELERLSPFNKKLMWTYGGFTVFTIIAFGTLTLVLHDAMLSGKPEALWLAGFIGIYWSLRIAVDAFYFKHKDWPSGNGFVLGHFLLTSLFIFLAGTYLGLIFWRVLWHIK